jgi:hypothetical protein
MPAFAGVMSVKERWDVINVIHARAAGVLARSFGPEMTAVVAPQVPDFAFETDGVHQTLRQEFETGPVLLLLFAPPRSRASGSWPQLSPSSRPHTLTW